MSSELIAVDNGARLSRSREVQQLAARVAVCASRAEWVLSGVRATQLLDWQSPAGRAYRGSVALQAAALARARERLQDAGAAVDRHALAVAEPCGNLTGTS
jgi:MarR-like DNA-binding transcriptional regulator SgrR of sgrS sRNA